MQFFYNNSTSIRTKPLYTFLFCIILIIIPGIILWIFFGYINLSGYFLIFPAYGHIASGNYNEIVNKLQLIINSHKTPEPIKKNLEEFLEALINNQNSDSTNKINGNVSLSLLSLHQSYINPLICAVIFSYLVWSIILPYLAKFTKVINYDVITFSLTCAGVICVIILTGAIPVGKISGTNFDNLSGWIIFARIVISGISVPFFFYFANKIVMVSLKTSKKQTDFYMQLTKETLDVQEKEKQLRDKRIKQKTENKEPFYVEIDPKDVDLKNDKNKENKK